VPKVPLVIALAAMGMGMSLIDQGSRRVEYSDLTPEIERRLAAAGITKQNLAAYLGRVEKDTEQRVIEGNREHLIYYALQSRRFTNRTAIEPAVSARRFVEALPERERARLLADPAYLPSAKWPHDERTRLTDLLAALATPSEDSRLAILKGVAGQAATVDAFFGDYARVARFLYLKEFSPSRDATTVARLYQTRAHSTDTQIEAGFSVYTGLAILHALDPSFRLTRVLIVGPGLDLAPRTDLIDAADPQSYQPLAVADALLALSLAPANDLRIHAIDVNPLVVQAVQHAARDGFTWHLFSGIGETPARPFSTDYREYLQRLGRAIGEQLQPPANLRANRHYRHSIAVRPSVARQMSAERLNVITDRLTGEPRFDLIVVTNVFPYFDNPQLALAMANIAAMLRPRGYLLHNEPREGLREVAGSLGLPVIQTRSAIVAESPSQPLYDVVWLHQKR
jgi:hypothetical protein